MRAVRERLKNGPPPAPDAITAQLRRWIQHVEIEAEMIELDELGDLIPGWASSSSSTDIDDRERPAIERIAHAAG